jgi:hypothetical protein
MIIEPKITEGNIADIRALIAGTADQDQQKRGMAWIMLEACGRLNSPYFSGAEGERDTTFQLGRHYVGILISNMTETRTLQKAKRQKNEAD